MQWGVMGQSNEEMRQTHVFPYETLVFAYEMLIGVVPLAVSSGAKPEDRPVLSSTPAPNFSKHANISKIALYFA